MMMTYFVFDQYGDQRNIVHGRIISTNQDFINIPDKRWTKELWIEWCDPELDSLVAVVEKDWDQVTIEPKTLALYNVEKNKVRRKPVPNTWVIA